MSNSDLPKRSLSSNRLSRFNWRVTCCTQTQWCATNRSSAHYIKGKFWVLTQWRIWTIVQRKLFSIKLCSRTSALQFQYPSLSITALSPKKNNVTRVILSLPSKIRWITLPMPGIFFTGCLDIKSIMTCRSAGKIKCPFGLLMSVQI